MKKLKIASALTLVATQNSFAVLPFLVETDNTGQFLSGSYSGNGTVQPNVVPGNFDVNGLQNPVLVEGMTAGTLSMLTEVVPANTRVSTTLRAGVAVNLTGGSGDLRVANSANFDGGNTKFNSVGLTGLAGVTEIFVTVSFNQYVAGRNDGTTNITSRPIMSALGLVATGSGLTKDNFKVEMAYPEARYSTNGTTFTDGGPGVTALSSSAWDTKDNTNLLYTANGMGGTVQLGGIGSGDDNNFLMVKGFDINESGTYTATDAPNFYAITQTWKITPTGTGVSSFVEGTRFTFSLDGQQYANRSLVPEPSTSLLGALGGLIALGYRRRKRA